MSNIDELTKKVSDLVAEIDALAKAKHVYTFSHDDGVDDEIDASDPSSEDTDAENSDDDEEDGDNTDLGKATINAAVMRNDPTYRPGALKESSHSQSTHKFEALVSKIVNEHGIPASQAQAYVRVNYPEVYHSYQQFSSDTTAKRAPDLVEMEMRKGVTREVAQQRVAQLYGYRAFDTPDRLNKRADDAEYDLIAKANEVWADSDLSRCEALRETRLANPRLHRVLTRG
jgi:hypothetical protein